MWLMAFASSGISVVEIPRVDNGFAKNVAKLEVDRMEMLQDFWTSCLFGQNVWAFLFVSF